MDLARVIIFTPDVERLSRFYRECFALSDVAGADDGWAELEAGGCKLAFHRYSEEVHGPKEVDGRDSGVKVVFGSTDVTAEKQRLESIGVQMSDIVEFGNIQLCDGQDPDGNRFQISSRGF